jgi:hypothetical protein
MNMHFLRIAPRRVREEGLGKYWGRKLRQLHISVLAASGAGREIGNSHLGMIEMLR